MKENTGKDPKILESLQDLEPWVRQIARSLVRDVNQAEDLAQQTMLSAMERPPAENRNLRAWFRVATWRTFLQFKRSAQRRKRRESHASFPESDLPPEDGIDRKFIRDHISQSLQSLEEPYRRTMHLRYIEELTPTEIAKREGAPLPTVKARLQRGLALLRGKLDQKFGSREQWVVAFLPLAAAQAPKIAASVKAALILLAPGALLVYVAIPKGDAETATQPVTPKEVQVANLPENTPTPKTETLIAEPIPEKEASPPVEQPVEISKPAAKAAETPVAVAPQTKETVPPPSESPAPTKAPSSKENPQKGVEPKNKSPEDPPKPKHPFPMTGRVVDLSGKAVPDLQLSWLSSQIRRDLPDLGGQRWSELPWREWPKQLGGEILSVPLQPDGSFSTRTPEATGIVWPLSDSRNTILAAVFVEMEPVPNILLIAAAPLELSGRILDRNRHPIRGAKIRVVVPRESIEALPFVSGDVKAAYYLPTWRDTTEDDGKFLLSHIPQWNEALIRVEAEGFHTEVQPISWTKNSSVEIKLFPSSAPMPPR